ncbi:hypothetical protein KEJ15_02170 [Candidatus Bathyarchaeota archaeon]|nr:hypothetical protein [Candidatus Bathyarchaeota archaeon]
MPEFLEEFASSVSNKRETLKEKIFKGTPNPLQNSFERHFESHWISLSETDKYSLKTSEVEIMAVDSSVYTNLLSTGGIFYVTDMEGAKIFRKRK